MNPVVNSGVPSPLLAVAVELAGGDQTVACRLLHMIVETNQATLALLRDSVHAESWDNAASAAHRLAGSARILECEDFAGLVSELETAARAHQGVLATTLLPHVIGAATEFEASIRTVLRVMDQS
jgi:HPt (histidine-containing phosphotransfer) domain-containing protein